MRMHGLVGAAVLVVTLLAGCAPSPGDDDTGTPAPEETTEPSTEPTEQAPVAHVFRMPTQCTDIVTAETAERFEAQGLELLGGPGGVYGVNYFGDPTPEEQAGGISCVWGDEDSPATTVIVSVAPISTGSRSRIVKALVDNGLIESQVDSAISYARIGDEVSAPGELHVIRVESWISVIEAVGGEERFEHATELVDEVTAQVYVAP